ncbi:uncharacterized protein LOC144449465 [Glandiceps talaboti]
MAETEIRKRKNVSEGASPDKSDLPEIKRATDEEKKLPLEDKLKIIDDEIRLLRAFCVQSGFSQAEIESSARPVLGFLKDANRQKWKHRAIKVVLLFSLVAFLYYYDPAYDLVRVYSRYTQLKTLKYWDWTDIYENDCIIENPYYEVASLTESDCEDCEGLDEIEGTSEVTEDEMTEEFVYVHVPVIVTDAIDNWKAYKEFDTEFIAKLFFDDSVINSTKICNFYNADNRYTYVKQVMRGIRNGTNTEWHMHWENCNDRPVKQIRKYYQRPYFIPPMVEMRMSNWIFVSSGVRKGKQQALGSDFVSSLNTGASMTWFAQLKGHYEVKLTPHHICKDSCNVITATLSPGDMLVFTNQMWTFEYRVVQEDDAVALSSSGDFD